MVHSLDEARSAISAARAGHYLDVHAWCFTPASFRVLIEDLATLDYIKCRETAFFPTEGNEFFIALGPNGIGAGVSRKELAIIACRE